MYIKKKLKNIPHSPGIYIFKNIKNKPLYIGKASDLKNRVRYYLKTSDVRLQKMITMADRLNYIKTTSDIEALILESQNIKKYRPLFNIVMKDDKQYGFVGFTKEKYPRVFITHQPPKSLQAYKLTNLQANYIGPFTDIGALKTTLRYLRRIFPYCTCKQLHNNYCLNYHIGKCHGFCCLKNPDFKTSPQSPANTQRSSCIGSYRRGIVAIKEILSGKKNSLVKNIEKEMMTLGKAGRFEEALELRQKVEKLKRIFKNARIIKSIDISKYGCKNILEKMRQIFGLEKSPIRIEGYDIANIQGKYAVGAMVVFNNDEPDKNEYRKFKIYKKQTSDDPAMLKEVLERRFNHPEWPMPHLIVVDGGKQQLNVTHSVISNFKFLIYKPTVIALTKNKKHKGEKIYISGRNGSLPLSQLPKPVNDLLLTIDSEAHRFAISYYRHLHNKSLIPHLLCRS